MNLRGAAGDAGKTELEEEGVDATSAKDVVELLRRCEDARFSPDGVDIASARETWASAKTALDAFGKSAGGGEGRKPA